MTFWPQVPPNVQLKVNAVGNVVVLHLEQAADGVLISDDAVEVAH